MLFHKDSVLVSPGVVRNFARHERRPREWCPSEILHKLVSCKKVAAEKCRSDHFWQGHFLAISDKKCRTEANAGSRNVSCAAQCGQMRLHRSSASVEPLSFTRMTRFNVLRRDHQSWHPTHDSVLDKIMQSAVLGDIFGHLCMNVR